MNWQHISFSVWLNLDGKNIPLQWFQNKELSCWFLILVYHFQFNTHWKQGIWGYITVTRNHCFKFLDFNFSLCIISWGFNIFPWKRWIQSQTGEASPWIQSQTGEASPFYVPFISTSSTIWLTFDISIFVITYTECTVSTTGLLCCFKIFCCMKSDINETQILIQNELLYNNYHVNMPFSSPILWL